MIFLDTEFTDLLRPELLSIGLVSIDGAEFYAEIGLATEEGQQRRAASSEFVRNGGVLDMWGVVPGSAGTVWEMGRRAGAWILDQTPSADGRITVAFDAPVDFELLEQAIRNSGLWDAVGLAVRPIDVDRLTGTIVGELAAEEAYRRLSGRGLRRHHALADAIALRAAYLAVSKPPSFLLRLPPRQYRNSTHMAASADVSDLTVLPLPDGRATVERHFYLKSWYPLTTRVDPAWRIWPSVAEAAAEVQAEGAPLLDWPHWGRP